MTLIYVVSLSLTTSFLDAQLRLNPYVKVIDTMMNFSPASVHFSKRAFDKKFEIVAHADVKYGKDHRDVTKRWVTLDVVNTHSDAIEAVRKLRDTKK